MTALTKTTVTYHIEKPDGTPWAHRLVFQLVPGGYDANGMAPGAVVHGAVDANGDGEIDLWANEGGDESSFYRCVLPSGEQFTFTVPTTGGPYTLSELRALGQTASDPQFPTIIGLLPFVSVKLRGATGDGTTDDYAALQAMLDQLGTAGGGIAFFPIGTYKVTSPLDVPNGVYLWGAGNVYPASGAVVSYAGTAQAIRGKAGFADTDNTRNIGIAHLTVLLTGAGATGVQLEAAKSCTLENVLVRMAGGAASAQIGLHLKAERSGGTYSGCFYNRITQLRILGDSKANGHTGVKFTGTASDGQVNANTFAEVAIDGVDKAWVLGPASMNRVFGFTCENVQTTALEFQANALGNQFIGGYFEQVATMIDFKASSQDNRVVVGTLASVTTRATDAGTTNRVEYSNIQYGTPTGQEGGKFVQFRKTNETFSRLCLNAGGFYTGPGTADPTDAASVGRRFSYLEKTINTITTSTADPTITPNCANGYGMYFVLDTSTSGTVTIAAPTNSFAEGDVVSVEIINQSGGALTLAWNASYRPNSSLTTSMNNGTRYTVQFRRRSTLWIIMGAAFGPA